MTFFSGLCEYWTVDDDVLYRGVCVGEGHMESSVFSIKYPCMEI